MAMLLFYAGEERYACEDDLLFEVLPALPLPPLAQAPPYVVGMLQYREGPVPIVDFVQLRTGRPCAMQFSSRILIIRYSSAQGYEWMGLLVERATSMIALEKEDFAPSQMILQNETYVVGVHADQEGVIKRVDIRILLEMLHTELAQEINLRSDDGRG